MPATQLFDARIDNLRARLAKAKVQALLVTNDKDIRYLTGFVGHDSWALVTAKDGPVTILSDRRFEEQIQREAPQCVAVMRDAGLADELLKLKKSLRLKSVGIQPSYLTLAQHKGISKKVGRGLLKPISDGLIEQRSVKDAAEVETIQAALKIQQKAYRELLAWIKPGMTEESIAAQLEFTMRNLGADGPSFNTIIAADANASLPHAIPGKAKVKKGGIILIDWGARYRGYCGDMTRVVALGSMPEKIKDIYKVCLEAQLAGIAAVAPGKALKEVDEAARKIIVDAGLGDRFGHSLGHGIGLDIHEEPRLSARSEGVLQPGQIVTVEPGIYIPGLGGVRIEDDVLVTEKGGRVLSDLPKSLESAII